MEKSTIIQSASFDEAEIEVSDILLNLKSLIEESESRSRVPPLLSSYKRKRSDRNLGLNSQCKSSPPNSVQRNPQAQEEDSDNAEIEPKSVKLKSETASPNTPLAFSPAEVDDNPKQHSSENEKSSNEKTREELVSDIEELTQSRDILRREDVKNVRSYYDRQKAYNLELKAMREKVMTNLNGQGLQTSHTLQNPMGQQLQQAQPFQPSANGLGSVNHSGPVRLPYHMSQYRMGQQLQQTQPFPSSANGLGSVNQTGPIRPPYHISQYPTGQLQQARPISSSANGLGSGNQTGPRALPYQMSQYPMGQLQQAQPMSSSANGLGSMSQTGPIRLPYQMHQYPMGQLPQAQPNSSSANRLGFVNHTGPVGIPDLNVTLMEAFTMISLSQCAEKKPQYKEARRNRMRKIEIKKSCRLNIRPPRR